MFLYKKEEHFPHDLATGMDDSTTAIRIDATYPDYQYYVDSFVVLRASGYDNPLPFGI